MTKQDWKETADQFRYAARVIALPALPTAWPDWMTYEKRREMAERLLEAAHIIDTEK